MGSKQDGSKAEWVESGTDRKRDELNLRDFEDLQPSVPIFSFT